MILMFAGGRMFGSIVLGVPVDDTDGVTGSRLMMVIIVPMKLPESDHSLMTLCRKVMAANRWAIFANTE